MHGILMYYITKITCSKVGQQRYIQANILYSIFYLGEYIQIWPLGCIHQLWISLFYYIHTYIV